MPEKCEGRKRLVITFEITDDEEFKENGDLYIARVEGTALCAHGRSEGDAMFNLQVVLEDLDESEWQSVISERN
jgi:hypothetical protein